MSDFAMIQHLCYVFSLWVNSYLCEVIIYDLYQLPIISMRYEFTRYNLYK